jgi:predicted nucleic acid-binding protein
LSHPDFIRIYELIKSRIKFVNQLLINHDNYEKAVEIANEIDPDDVLFVGLSIQNRCKLWTGDKKLIQGLLHKNHQQIITTIQLFQIYLDHELKRKWQQK